MLNFTTASLRIREVRIVLIYNKLLIKECINDNI